MNAKPFAIIRTAKIRTLRQLKAAAEHNDRTAEQGTEHADPTRPPELIAGDADAVASWRAAMVSKGLDPDATRKGAVVAVEWLATASPEFWAGATPEQRAAWQADTLAFVADEMAGPERTGETPEARAKRGRGLILSAHYHDDETTPHMHILAVPLVEKERAAKGRPRKRDAGKPRPVPGPSWGLAAKDILGGPRGRMSELQDDYAAAMEPHGLRRGIPRKETGERNKAPAKWRAEQAQLTDAARADRVEAAGERKEARAALKEGQMFRQAATEGAMDRTARAQKQATEIVGAAKTQAGAILTAAGDKAAAMVEWSKGLAEAVRADAERIGRAISFPSYSNRPESAEARQAVAAAVARRAAEKAAQAALNRTGSSTPDRSTQRRRDDDAER